MLLPAIVLSCSAQQAENDMDSLDASKQTVVIEDLGLSLELPEGWTEYQEPLRATLADRMSQMSEEELSTVDTEERQKLEHGVNLFTFNNLEQYGSISDEDIFGYFLTTEPADMLVSSDSPFHRAKCRAPTRGQISTWMASSTWPSATRAAIQ